jgi:hypothetical protein
VVRDSVQVEVQGDTIIVTMRGDFRVTYSKPADSAGLIASHFMHRRPGNLSKRAEFLAKAWKLANDKARELGWIV